MTAPPGERESRTKAPTRTTARDLPGIADRDSTITLDYHRVSRDVNRIVTLSLRPSLLEHTWKTHSGQAPRRRFDVASRRLVPLSHSVPQKSDNTINRINAETNRL